jgi:hypothetical protein
LSVSSHDHRARPREPKQLRPGFQTESTRGRAAQLYNSTRR